MSDSPRHVYQAFIQATPEQVWQALTDGDFTRRYFFGSVIKGPMTTGSDYVYDDAETGDRLVEGKIVEADPPRRLVMTWSILYDPELASDRPSRVSWEIERRGKACLLTAIHDDFDGETATFREVAGGWAQVISSLKTLLETGKPLVVGELATPAAV